MNTIQRPSPVLATRRERVTVSFGPLKSPLTMALEALELAKEEGMDGNRLAPLEETIAEFEADGLVPWVLSGTMLQRLPGVDGHTVADLTENLAARFIRPQGNEGVPGVDADQQRVSLHLCRNVALVHTVVVTLDGGEPYTPEELLALAHNMEDCWSALLFEVLAKVTANPTKPAVPTSG